MPRNPNRIGYMHTHIDPYNNGQYDEDGTPLRDTPIQMFSPEDVRQFLTIVVNAQIYGTPIGDTYGVMVSSAGTYQLAFTGNVADIHQKQSSINWDRLDRIYKKYTINDPVGGFLNFLKNKIGIDGIELYKVEATGNTKMTLDSAGEIVPINCN